MAKCAIEPDSDGHVTIPDDWSGLVNGSIPYEAFQQRMVTTLWKYGVQLYAGTAEGIRKRE